MPPIFTIVGATGAQGGSVLDSALKSRLYSIRAITRDVSSANSRALKSRGVEVVAADLDSEESLIKAFEGSTAIFGLTNFFEAFVKFGPVAAVSIEVKQGKNLASAASKTPTLKHYIWSTLPDSERISEGRISVPHFQGKVQIDAFIKGYEKLYAKTTFLWVGPYAQNFQYPWFTPSFLKTSGKHIQLGPVPSSTPIQTIGDINTNVGVFTSAILAQPGLTQGKFVLASVENTTISGMLQAWGEATSKDTLYIELASIEEYDKIWPVWGKEIGLMLKFWGIVGKDSWSGEEVVTGEDLDLKDDQFMGSKATFAKMNWN
ncbi:hypothetical protein BKA65DRAFT_387582 [Rhexocercosporidium sp. MPI-PUGE-AT-0058]|nr:hypothetical protein BKA65DRAFT_387582 [Rhexocercosporidium sp. MPI-PUGE-AT-0058]